MTERRCRICRILLSRYNAAAVCSACARTIAQVPDFPAWLWDSQPLRRALAELDLAAALTIIRTAPGLSQLEFANVVGWSQSGVARAESGQRDSLYDIRRLLNLVDTLGIPRKALIPLVLGNTDAEQATAEGTDEMDLNRREFGSGLVGMAAALGLDGVDTPSKASAAHPRYFRAATDKLYTRDQKIGGGVLVREGLRLYLRARRLIKESAYTESVGQQLMSAAGELAICVGWLAYDGGNQALSRDLYSEARILADQAGDEVLAAQSLELMSFQSVGVARRKNAAGSAREAVRLSKRATELARHDPSPRLHALLATREATAHAAVGDRQGFSSAIGRAWRHIDRGLEADGPIALRFVSSAEILAQEARGNLYLENPGKASKLYRKSLESPLSNRNRAIYRAGLSASLATDGDVEGAATEGMIVLRELESGIASRRTLSTLEPVRVIAHNSRTGKDFAANYDRIGKSLI